MRRLIPLLSVLFALAVGLALGAGPLDDKRGDAAPAQHARRSAPAFDETFASTVAPALYAHRLAKQSVAVVTTPGASPATVKALVDQIVTAGGAVASRTELTRALTAPGQKTLVDTMGSQLATQLGQQVPALADPALSTYPRMGRLVGLAVATTGAPAAASAPASTVRESLKAAKLTSGLSGDTAGVAPLVLVVLGKDLDDAIADGLVQGLAAQAHGVVVAGRSNSADIAALRKRDTPAATVDGTESGAGRVAAVLALVHQIEGGGGSFGASGIDGAVPVG
ncbi:copper transporter [Nocardioides sp. CER19]|uniref:copper transporter n=1 Tax=Nocardioides sp. CER19 TaxID=3038538 RepID=UPI00244B5AB9|nr:copper transporter [Nocardioides sp. CER19]MDH2415570.1 copper transporter [Nocardioides sp. CER19]